MKWAGVTAPLSQYRAPKRIANTPHPLPGLNGDIDKLLACTDRQELRALVALGGLVGCRIGEAIKVHASHFHSTVGADRTVRIHGKGEKVRFVPVSDRAWEVLLPSVAFSLANDCPLAPLGERNARRLITVLGSQAGLARPISSHDLRATFATLAQARIKDIHIVSKLLGHSDVETTMVYVEASREAMREAVGF